MNGTVVLKYDPFQPVDSPNFTYSFQGTLETKSEVTVRGFLDVLDIEQGKVGDFLKYLPVFSTTEEVIAGSLGFSQAEDTHHTFNLVSIKKLLDKPVDIPQTIYSNEPLYKLLQKWECTVLSVGDDSFIARLIDKTNDGPDEEAEFSREEITIEDLPLLKPGAVFYWNIGFLDKISGQRQRVSIIRFRRLPAWTSEEIESARNEAISMGEKSGWK